MIAIPLIKAMSAPPTAYIRPSARISQDNFFFASNHAPRQKPRAAPMETNPVKTFSSKDLIG
jgi:hypothetical protein